MKKFRRFLSGVVAMATLLTGMAFPVSATTYDQCDLNKDRYVGVADAAIFNKYLAGSYYVPNYNILDFNKSLTVDAADAEYIYAKLYGTSYSAGYWSRRDKSETPDGSLIDFPTVSGFTPDDYASSTDERKYRRYSYKQKKELTPYTLTPTLENLNSNVNSRGVIGDDDRKIAEGDENTGIVHISLDVNGKPGRATGFVVGDHQIATNAHCVYDDGWYSISTIKTYNNKNNNADIPDKLTPVEAHIPSDFSNDSHTYDYALITVEEDLSEYDFVFFSLGSSYNLTKEDFKGVPIYITGIPGETTYDGNNRTTLNLYSAEGCILSSDYSSLILCNVDASDGQSGSPIYTITQNKVGNSTYYTYTALGIYKGGKKDDVSDEYIYNGGPLITKYHLQFYNNNPNANYTVD